MEPTSRAIQKFNQFLQTSDCQQIEHIDNLQRVFLNPRYKLVKARDLYPFYVSLQKVLADTSSKPEAQTKLLKVLRLENGRSIERVGLPPIELDFAPFLNVDRSAASFTLHIVDRLNEKEISEAASIIDEISLEGIGKSYGSSVYQAIIGSKDALCVLGMLGNKTAGCLLGTSVSLKDGTDVFHIWACVRKANSPGKGFVSLLNSIESEVIARFSPHWITLCVDEDNTLAHQLYAKSGFQEVERAHNDYSDCLSIFMARRLRETDLQPPLMHPVREAVRESSLATLGLGSGIFLMLANKITELAYKALYS